MITQIPPEFGRLLKPGVLARLEDSDGAWSLYEPTRDLFCRFNACSAENPSERPGRESADWLCPEDLQSSKLCWQAGRFDAQRYYLAHAFRASDSLREANLEINYVCHYGRRHCFQSLTAHGGGDASPPIEKLCAAADRLLQAGVTDLAITGGDIFLHPGLWDLLEHMQRRARDVTLRLLVNGGALDLESDETLRRFRSLSGQRVIVKSEFFGHDAALHDDFTRVSGSFERLLGVAELCRSADVVFMASGALTRENYATRFELVNFLYNLTSDRFGMHSIMYPSDYRQPDQLSTLRLSTRQYAGLLEERYFAPLVSEYHSFEPQCGGDCQLTVLAPDNSTWGCSFSKQTPFVRRDLSRPGPDGDEAEQSFDTPLAAWRDHAERLAVGPDCGVCPARETCRRCPSFLAGVSVEEDYCEASRAAHVHLSRRLESALRSGFDSVHAPGRAFGEVCHER